MSKWVYELKATYVKKDYIWTLATRSCENDNYFASIIDDSVITCDETIVTIETVPTNTDPPKFNEKKITCKTKKLFCFTHVFINCDSIIDSC